MAIMNTVIISQHIQQLSTAFVVYIILRISCGNSKNTVSSARFLSQNFQMLGRFLFYFSRVNPKFCVNAKLWCKIEQKYFKAGAAQAAAAFSTKITALRGDVKGGGVSLRSSRLLTFRLQPVSPACGRQRTPPTVCELRSSPAAFRSTSS